MVGVRVIYDFYRVNYKGEEFHENMVWIPVATVAFLVVSCRLLLWWNNLPYKLANYLSEKERKSSNIL